MKTIIRTITALIALLMLPNAMAAAPDDMNARPLEVVVGQVVDTAPARIDNQRNVIITAGATLVATLKDKITASHSFRLVGADKQRIRIFISTCSTESGAEDHVAYSVMWMITDPHQQCFDSHIMTTEMGSFTLGKNVIDKLADEIFAKTDKLITK